MQRTLIAEKLDVGIRFLIYLLIFWLPYSIAMVEISVGVALLLWVIKRFLLFDWQFANKSVKEIGESLLSAFQPKDSYLNKPIAYFLFFCVISTLVSPYTTEAMKGFLTKTLEWFVIYFLVIEVFTKKRHVLIALGVFLFTAFSTCLDAMYQYHISGEDIFNGKTLKKGRATAGFRHPNSLGGYLTILLPFVVSWLIGEKKKRIKCLMLLIMAVACWALVISYSRGAWLAVFGGFVAFILFSGSKKFLRIGVSSIAILFCLYFVFMPFLKQKMGSSFQARGATIQFRLGVWEDTITMIRERPLFGHGLNMYMRVFDKIKRKEQGLYQTGSTYAHNCYLQMWAEVGIFGFLAFLWIFVRFYQYLVEFIYQKSGDDQLRHIFVGLLAGATAFLIHSFVDTNFYTIQLSAYFWSTAGLLFAIAQILREQPGVELKRL